MKHFVHTAGQATPCIFADGAVDAAYRRVARTYALGLLLLAPVVLGFWSGQNGSEGIVTALNSHLPFVLIAVLAFVTMRTVAVMPDAVWTGFVWIPLQSALFYGFGPLVINWGNEATLLQGSAHFFWPSQHDLARAQLLSALGIWLVLLGMWLTMVAVPLPSRVRRSAKAGAPLPASTVAPFALGAIAVGCVFTHAVLRPVQWGLVELTIPGVLTSFALLTDLGFALLAYATTLRGGRRWRLLFVALLVPHLLLSLLPFAKTAAVSAVLLPVLGLYLGRRRLGDLAIGAVLVLAVFIVTQPLVAHGRAALSERNGDHNLGGYGERVAIVVGYFAGASAGGGLSADLDPSRVQEWWMRLSYSGPQAAAMGLYDEGHPHDDLSNAWMRFIPRAVWPEKPVMVGPGMAFYQTVSGRPDASVLVGISIYADMYWHYGWGGVLVIAPAVGLVFGLFSRLFLAYVVGRRLLYFPVVLVAIPWFALGPNKFLTNGVIGTIPILLAYVFLFKAIEDNLANTARHGRRKGCRQAPFAHLTAGADPCGIRPARGGRLGPAARMTTAVPPD